MVRLRDGENNMITFAVVNVVKEITDEAFSYRDIIAETILNQ